MTTIMTGRSPLSWVINVRYFELQRWVWTHAKAQTSLIDSWSIRVDIEAELSK